MESRTRDTSESRSEIHKTDRTLDPDRRRVGTPSDVGEQHRRFGGFSFASAFFGWLSATGMAALLLALLAAGGAVFAFSEQHAISTGKHNAATISLAAGIGLVVVLAIAYFAGGYVAGRMARFDGIRQGIGVWVIGVLVTALLAGAGAAFGSKYNVLANLNMPNIPVDEGSLTTGGGISLLAAILATLGSAIIGGRTGEAYHRRVDRAGRL
jgi:hypothetical protein